MKKYSAALLVLATVSVLAFGWLDHEVGEEVHLFVLHLVPIGVVTWFLGATEGLVIAIFAALVWVVGSGSLGQGDSSVMLWNLLSTLAVFLGLNTLLARLQRTVEEARHLAETDTLTGVLNRRGFWRAAERELKRAQRYGTPLTVAYLDLDNFKSVNDTFGHPTGDALLTLVAQTMVHTMRGVDAVARLGGDEFVILLPDTSRAAAYAVANKLHRTLVDAMTRYNWQVTASIGLASLEPPPPTITVDDLLRQADIAMYQAKAQGKNRVQASGEALAVPTPLN